MLLRTIVDKTSFEIKTRYMKKESNEAEWKKISKERWFDYYDKSFVDSSIEVLAPLTIE